MRDLHNNVAVSQLLPSLIRTADATSATLDLAGYDAAEVTVNVGASGDTLSGTVYWDFILQESTDGTVFSAVADADCLSKGNALTTVTDGVFATVDSTDDDNTTYKIGYGGGKRYLHVKADATGTHSNGTSFGVDGVKAKPNQGGV